jgi:membrane-associated phospholipid phosphatase
MSRLNPDLQFLVRLRQWLTQNGLLLGLSMPLTAFGLLTWQIWRHEGGLNWDLAILTAIHSTAQPWLDQLAQNLTQLGTKWGVFPATVLVSGKLLYNQRWRALIYWLMAIVGGGLLNCAAKLWLHRVRPSLWDYPQLSDFSFPSGHAMLSLMFVLALSWLTMHQPWNRWVWLVGGLFVGMIGWTRLYLGVHYPSDVLGGWMLGAAWVIAVSLVVKPMRSIAQDAPGAQSNSPDRESAK